MNIPMLLKPKAMIAFLNDTNTVRQGLEKMNYHGYTALPVIDDEGRYCGTVSEGDFLRLMHDVKNGKRPDGKYIIRDIMHKPRDARNTPVTVNATMDELYNRVIDQNFVPVTDDRGMFIGIVTRRDVIIQLYSKYKELEKASEDCPVCSTKQM